MKKLLIIFLLFFSVISNAQFVNKGAAISLTKDALLTIDMDVNNSGEISHKGKIEVTGNWNNYSSLGGFIRSSDGIMDFSGGNQIIGGSYSAIFPTLYLTGSGVKSLGQDVEILNFLSLGTRELAVNTQKLMLSANSPESLERTTGFISTEEKGYFYRIMAANNTYIYPMGTQNTGQVLLRPVSIVPSTSEKSNIGVSFVYKDANSSLYTRNNKKDNITEINSRYFHMLDRIEGNSAVEISFHYNAQEEEPFNELVHWTNNYVWEKIGLVKSSKNENADLDKVLTFSANDFSNLPVALASTGTAHNLTFYNSFTPDGDGKNDTWSIGSIDDYPDNEITIFNRWGGEVFKTKSFSSSNPWDGSKLNDGTYYYLLKVKINDEYKVFKGFISLLKGQK